MTAAAASAGGATAGELRALLRHRDVGAALLAGHGLEIGALHYPLAAPAGTTVDYLDVDSAATLRERFPELRDAVLVEARWIGDIVRATVPTITGRCFDFIVMNHVLEHVANPIQAIANVWHGLVDGGLLVLSVPDKHYTFDHARRLTSLQHVVAEFYQATTDVDPSHYVEFLEHTMPEAFGDRRRFLAALERVTQRREHAHVWDSASFRALWDGSAQLLGLEATVVYESTAAVNRFEYFAVVCKAPCGRRRADESLRVLAALYRARRDLQRAFPASEACLAERLLAWATTAGASVDSDAATLRAFQDHYRRLMAETARDGSRLEEQLRAALLV